MRSRRPEGGGGGVRIRSPPPAKVRDHHRSDWHPSPYKKEGFSPSLERERPSRRRSLSVERRDFSRHFDGGRDDGGGRIRSRPMNESFPHRESPHVEYRHNYFDANNEENPNLKHVGVSGIGGGGGGGSRATKDKDFQGNGSSGLDSLGKKSMCLEDGMRRSFFTLPPDAGYSSAGFNLSKIGGSSSTFPSKSSLGGNLNIGLHEDGDIRYHDRLTSIKIPAREPHEEEKQRTFYSRDVSYPMLPSSPSSQLKAFGSTSSGPTRDDFFSSYRDSLNYRSVGRSSRNIGGKFMNPLDCEGYGVEQNLLDPSNDPEMESKDMKPYQRGMLSPARDEPRGYSFLELNRRDRTGSGFLSDKLYKKMQLGARGDYSLMDPLGLTFTGHIGDRIDDTDSSRRTLRETGGGLWDHQPLPGDPVTSYHDVNRGLSSAMDRRGEHFGPGDTHLEFVTKVTRDHDILHSGGDYGFGRDAGPVGYRARLRSPPLSDRDPDTYRLDMDTQRRSNVEDLGVYDPSERTYKGKYVIDEINRHNHRSALPNTRSTSRHIQKRSGSDEHERWTGEDRVGFFPSKRLGFGRASYKIPGRSFGGSRKVTRHNAWLPSEDVSLRVRMVGGRGANLKRRLRPGPSEFHNSFQFDKRQDFYRPHKFQKGSLDDRLGGANAHDGDAVEEATPLVKTDPLEGSEEFKQQVHRAFLRFAKQLNENLAQQRRYREQGKAGSLLCSACGSHSKEFLDTHSLVTHAFNSQRVGLRTDHLGLHKALCVMMGWNSLMAPDNQRAYQSMPAAEASSLKEDLILWPPLVIIHNSSIGNKDTNERVVVTNERMNEILREMGFGAGSKVCRGKPANHSILVVKFLPTFSGLQEAERLHKYYTENKRGRKELQQIASSNNSKGRGRGGEAQTDKVEELLLYGYMGIAEDLDKLDFEMKKRCVVKSMKEIEAIADASLNTD